FHGPARMFARGGGVKRDSVNLRAPAITAAGSPTLSRLRNSAVDAGGQDADRAQVAVALGVVEAVADHEVGGDLESHVLHVDGDLRGLRFAQQRADLHR